MESLLFGVFNGYSVFFALYTFHQLFSVSVFACHDVRDTKICQHDCGNLEQVIHLSTDKRLIELNGIVILLILHEEYMSNIKLPCLMISAVLRTLFKKLLHLPIVASIPVDLGLHHEYRDVLVESSIILLESRGDSLAVSSKS